jgi:hypothetical protein
MKKILVLQLALFISTIISCLYTAGYNTTGIWALITFGLFLSPFVIDFKIYKRVGDSPLVKFMEVK